MSKLGYIILAVVVLSAILFNMSMSNKYKNLIESTIDEYEADITTIQEENLKLEESNNNLLIHVQRFKSDIRTLEDSIEYYKEINQQNYEEIINSSDSVNVDLFYRNISKYKERFSINFSK